MFVSFLITILVACQLPLTPLQLPEWVPLPPAGTPAIAPLPRQISPDLLPAILLLSREPGTPEQVPSMSEFAALKDEVHQVAVDLEILDTREKGYIFAKLSDFQSDLDLLRRRYQEFKDAPLLAEAERLPDRKYVNELVAFNRAFRKTILERSYLEQDRSGIYQEIIIECDEAYRVWDAVRDANCQFYYISVRRQALIKLKTLLGDEGYYKMNLPPNVPVWRWRIEE